MQEDCQNGQERCLQLDMLLVYTKRQGKGQEFFSTPVSCPRPETVADLMNMAADLMNMTVDLMNMTVDLVKVPVNCVGTPEIFVESI